MLCAVAFDLDGTLIDSTDAIVASSLHVADTLGVERPSRQMIVDAIGHPLEVGLKLFFPGHEADLVSIYRTHYRATSRDATFLLPHVKETLAALHEAGLKIGFATSKKREMSEMLLEHLGVLHYFEARIGPDEVCEPKPHPDALYQSMKHLGVTAEEFIFVGDMDFDVKAAQAAGVACLAVATGYLSRAELEALGPDAVFDHLGEVRDYLLAAVSA